MNLNPLIKSTKIETVNKMSHSPLEDFQCYLQNLSTVQLQKEFSIGHPLTEMLFASLE